MKMSDITISITVAGEKKKASTFAPDCDHLPPIDQVAIFDRSMSSLRDAFLAASGMIDRHGQAVEGT